jgi:hypothetical protein
MSIVIVNAVTWAALKVAPTKTTTARPVAEWGQIRRFIVQLFYGTESREVFSSARL